MPHFFQQFSTDISGILLPERFTFPFYYEPHGLSIIAVKELQNYLENQKDFVHNFGLDPKQSGEVIGKMFGVLIVKRQNDELGYIAAFSGKLAGTNDHKIFVPPVYDMLQENSYFLTEEAEINAINTQLDALERNTSYLDLLTQLKATKTEAHADITDKKMDYKAAKSIRKEKRNEAKEKLSTTEFDAFSEALAKESMEAKSFVNNVQRYWQHQLRPIQEKIVEFETKITQLKEARKNKSNQLQQFLFEQYRFLNSEGQTKNLLDLFPEHTTLGVPAGAGECAAPKLLQYAFANSLQPIAMAEFWWGASPNKEIRKHQHYYPACQGKCKPILSHMLEGIEMDTNPMLVNPAIGKELEIVFEDESMMVVNKPADFLSVPGKHIHDSVYTRMSQRKDFSGPIIVHRLDMATSGLLVVAKNAKAHKRIQRQFIEKTVQKRYTAMLEGSVRAKTGLIELPLRVDLDDRPRQLVCYEHGKSAKTKWEVIEYLENQTKVHFYPISGRTHQLRVHASHAKGLNTPIKGDDLYGSKADRLYLHADSLSFAHPMTGKRMKFHRKSAF